MNRPKLSTRSRSLSTGRILILAILVALPLMASCYEILFMMPLGSRSHKNGLYFIAEELGRRGHQVTFFSGIDEKAEPEGVRNVLMKSRHAMEVYLNDLNFFKANVFSFENMNKMYTMVFRLIEEFYTDPFVQDLIQHPRNIMPTNASASSTATTTTTTTTENRYDVVVINAMLNEYCLPVAHHLGAPVVYASPTIIPLSMSWTTNIPTPPYVPSGIAIQMIDGRTTFWERMFTAVTNFAFLQLRSWYQLPNFDRCVREFLPDAPSIGDLERNVSFVMSNTHFSLNPSAPSMPYHAEVGCSHCKPAQKLPKDLQEFMQSSGDEGVIYFSFGSVQKGFGMPEDMKEKFLTVFSELPQKVLWKYEEAIRDLPSNVKLSKWAPQQDILGHTKTRLFISHCGGLSIHEVSYHGKPVLAIPLGGDQPGNAGNALRNGFAEYLDWTTFSVDDLRDKINILLHDPKYSENARKVSRLARDRPQRPSELAAYWIEYVVRHNGASHLKSGAENLNFFQYFLLDVISAILLIVVVVFAIVSYLSVFIVKKLIRYYLSRYGWNRNLNSRSNKKPHEETYAKKKN